MNNKAWLRPCFFCQLALLMRLRGMTDINQILKEIFKIRYLMPYQEMVITRILENSKEEKHSYDLTILPTGSGKSLCFMLPAFLFEKKYTILLYPLLSLMNDQAGRFKNLGIPYSLICGGMDKDIKHKELERLRRFESKILITNMESLLVLQSRNDLRFMHKKLELLVIDEAHTVSSWGLTFRPSYRELGRMIELLAPHQCHAFTATLDKDNEMNLKKMLFPLRCVNVLRASADRENIFYAAMRTLNFRMDLIRILKGDNRLPALVFCRYRKETERLSNLFSPYFKSSYYHAGLDKEERKKKEEEFAGCGSMVMFATNAYGMGVDKKDIRTVVHLSIPDSALDYLQETGRAGRDGDPSLAVLLYNPSDNGELSDVFKSGQCIRYGILEKMGDVSCKNGCLSCSSCSGFLTSCGEEEIKEKIRKHFLLHTEKTLLFFLLHKKKGGLDGWRKDEAAKALRILMKEGTVKSFLGHLYLAKRK